MLLIMAVAADATMPVAYSLPGAACRAVELHIQPLNRIEQAAQLTSVAARERGPSCAPSAAIVLLSICLLTMVEALMSAGAEAGQLTSLPPQAQAERE